MKKVLIVLALVALVLVPVAASNKKTISGIGGEAGYPAAGLTVTFDFSEKLDGYATAGYWYGGYAEVLAGAQGKIADFKIGDEVFDVKLGGLVGAQIGGSLRLIVAFTGAVSYDFSINNNADFTAYLRLGPGVSFRFGEEQLIHADFVGALGLVYHL